MPDFRLASSPVLGGFERDYGPVALRELATLAIVSLAVPLGGDAAAAAALRQAYGAARPGAGRYATSADGLLRIAATAPDQLFVLFEHREPDAREAVHRATGGAFYSVDQTDAWVALEIAGPMARDALARICPLDLHPDVFAADAAARTVMEHMGAWILRTGRESFWLLSASSSAESFLHAVETSIENVI